MVPEELVRPDPGARRPTRAELHGAGRAVRKRLPRRELATSHRTVRDPLAIIEEQDATRIDSLLPLRRERMLADPFAFYRGTAALMAADLADDPHTGLLVTSCGDAHLGNFGFFASPERRIVFDLNDFDEAAVAPWEWDVKRLVTSVVVGGLHAGYTGTAIRRTARDVVRTYARSLRSLVALTPTERYFMHANVLFARQSLDRRSRRTLNAALARAGRRTSDRAVRRTTEVTDEGVRRFVEEPPTMTHLEVEAEEMWHLYRAYRVTLDVDVDTVLSQYVPTDVVQRVVGVGSVGTRCLLVLLQGSDDDTLVLQVKEATDSVLTRYGRVPLSRRTEEGVAAQGNGFRVVGLQRSLQVVSDPFLGSFRHEGHDYYVRQFHDMKGSIELDGLPVGPFASYAGACATMLARAHSQSPGVDRVVGYLGRSDAAVNAVVQWSFDYAQQSLADFEALRAAGPTEG